jgi:hypothetical protein
MIALCLLLLAHDWVVVPGERVGPVRISTTKSELIALFGAEVVKDGEINVGEGDMHPGTLVYPDDPSQRLAILWEQGKSKRIDVCYGLRDGVCRWKTPQGVSIGTELKEIEKLNARPFKLAGFAWDYEGTIVSWEDGKLSRLFKSGELYLRLHPARPGGNSPPEAEQVRGDRFFFSSHPAMRKLNPTVYQMIVILPSAVSEHRKADRG